MSDPYADLVPTESADPYADLAPKQPNRLKAAATGPVAGIALDVAGAPANTAVNIYDLMKGVYNVGAGSLGLPGSKMLDMTDRSQVPGTSEWLANWMRNRNAGGYIDNPNPEDPASALLHSATRMGTDALLGARANPGSLMRAGIAGGIGGTAGEGANQAGLPPSSQILASMLAQGVAGAGGRWGAGKEAQLAQANVERSTRNQTAQEFMDKGGVLAPSDVRPTFPNKVLGTIAGTAETQRGASVKNEPLLNKLARDELGMTGERPVTLENIDTAPKVSAARQTYADLRNQPAVTLDRNIDLGETVARYKSVVAENPSQRIPQIDRLLADFEPKQGPPSIGGRQFNVSPQILAMNPGLAQTLGGAQGKTMSSGALLDLTKTLRNQGYANIKSDNGRTVQLGSVQLDIAKSLEGQMERHIAINEPQLMQDFRDARTTLAKAAEIKDALETSTGKVKAAPIGATFSKNPDLLSGNMRTIGATQEAFGKNVQDVSTLPTGFRWNDPRMIAYGLLGAGGIGGAAIGHPGSLALAALPPAAYGIRSFLLSPAGQKMMARPLIEKPRASSLAKRLLEPDMSNLLGSYIGSPQW